MTDQDSQIDLAQVIGTAVGAAFKGTDHDILVELRTTLAAIAVTLKETQRHTDQIDSRLSAIEQRIALIEQQHLSLPDRFLTVDGKVIAEVQRDVRLLQEDRIIKQTESRSYARIWVFAMGVANAIISGLAVYAARTIH